MKALFNLFMSGGLVGMGLITLLLICLLFAAWKGSPRVHIIGAAAPIVGLIWVFIQLYGAFDTLQRIPDIAPGVVYGGMKSFLVVLIYSFAVYLLSLIIRFFQKQKK